jgi:hypothetical protein
MNFSRVDFSAALRAAALGILIAGALIGATTARLHHDDLVARQKYHGWDRALEILTRQGQPKVELPKPEAMDFVNAVLQPLNWASLVSAPALQRLRESPLVESVHRLTYDAMHTDQGNRKIWITSVEPDFVTAFKLGSAAQLGNELVPSASPRAAQVIRQRYPNGEILLKKNYADSALSAESKARLAAMPPISRRVSDATFAPYPLRQPDITEFMVAADMAKSLADGQEGMVASLTVIIKLREGVDPGAALPVIQQILDEAPSALVFPGRVALVQPLADSLASHRVGLQLIRAGRWIAPATALAMAVLALAAIWLRFRAIALELALRRGFGHTRWQAVWGALQPEFFRFGIAGFAACAVAWCWFAVQGHPLAAPSLWPAAGAGLALGAGLAVLLARALLVKPTALLLKQQVD